MYLCDVTCRKPRIRTYKIPLILYQTEEMGIKIQRSAKFLFLVNHNGNYAYWRSSRELISAFECDAPDSVPEKMNADVTVILFPD